MEKRLIDANELKERLYGFCGELPRSTLAFAHGQINCSPTVDAVEVVRCGECKYCWKENELCCNDKCCHGNVAVVNAPPNHFCSYGERRSNVTNLLFADMEEIIDETD